MSICMSKCGKVSRFGGLRGLASVCAGPARGAKNRVAPAAFGRPSAVSFRDGAHAMIRRHRLWRTDPARPEKTHAHRADRHAVQLFHRTDAAEGTRARAADDPQDRHRRRRHGRLDGGADPRRGAAAEGHRDRGARVAGRRHHRRRRGIDAVAARLLRQPRHRGSGMDAGLQRDLQVRHHVRWLVDQAGLRELLPPVRLDARQPDDDAVRAQREGAPERIGRACASESFLHLFDARRPVSRAQARAQLPVRRLVRLPLRCGAARPVPAEEGARTRRQAQGLPRQARAVERTGRYRVGTHRRRRDDRRGFLRRLQRLRRLADPAGVEDAVRHFREQPVQRRRGRDADADRRRTSRRRRCRRR